MHCSPATAQACLYPVKNGALAPHPCPNLIVFCPLVGTGRDVWLTQQGIGRLLVSGIRTEHCCEITTRPASDLGWQVDFVLEATLTFDMTQPDGKVLPAADIAMRTATVLQDRCACVCMVKQALARAEGGAGLCRAF